MKKKNGSLALCLLGPLVLLVIGISLSGLFASKNIPRLFEETARGVLPAGFEAKLLEARDYTLWIYERGRTAGTEYNSSGSLPPGAKIFIFDSANGQKLPMVPRDSSVLNRYDERAISLGEFKAERGGQLVEVKATGLNMPLLVSISPANSLEVMSVMLQITGIVILFLAMAICVFNFLFRRRQALAGRSGE